MEHHVSSQEKCTSEHERMIVDMTADTASIKKSFLDMKELPRDLKENETMSKEGEKFSE